MVHGSERRVRRVAVAAAVAAGLAGLAGLPVQTGAAAPAATVASSTVGEPGVHRLSGPDRYAASAAISAATFAPGVPVAYVATGEKFPDALSGGPAGGYDGGPVLLVRSASVPASTAAELTRLRPQRIVVLGGTASVSGAVEAALGAYLPAGRTVERIAGADRYVVSARVSAATFAPGVPIAYVATGAKFPDALSGGPVGALGGGPVLLVRPDAVPAAVAAELARLAPRRVVVLGGTASVSAQVETSLAAYLPAGRSVERIDGADRYEASARISAESFGGRVDVAYVATGEKFPDALSGGPVGGVTSGPVLLVRSGSVPPATATELARLHPRRIVVLGGPASVSDAVRLALGAYVDYGGTPSVRGTVREDGGTGARLEGVRVTLGGPSLAGGPAPTAVTDANGVYAVVGVPSASDVTVCFDGSAATGGSVDPSGYADECWKNAVDPSRATPVTVTAGATTAGVDAALPGLGRASLRVTDTAGTRLGGVSFYVYGRDGSRLDGTSGPSATVLTGLASGLPYTVCYNAADATGGLAGPYGYDSVDCGAPDAPGAPTFTVAAGTTTGVTVTVTASGVVEGHVSDRSGNAVAGARVVVENEVTAGDGLTTEAVTGADGGYQVGRVRGNRTHEVCVVPPAGYAPTCTSVLVPQARSTALELVLAPAG